MSEECLELLAATSWFWIFSAGFIASIILTITAVFCPAVWWLPLLLILWTIYDRKTCENGGRSIDTIRKWSWWRLMKNYFNYKFIPPTTSLDGQRNYLFGCFPHGIFPIGPFAGFVDGYQQYFPKHTAYLTALNLQFLMPILRELYLAIGAVSVSAQSLRYLLSNGGGRIVTLMIGGGDEAKYSRPNCYKIILKKRKGFVKLALQTGTSLVPVFTFGEIDVFDQLNFPGFSTIQNIVKNLTQIGLVIPIGRYLICPKRVPIITIVGEPIDVEERIEKPTDEQINQLHQRFIDGLTQLFETHKHKYVAHPDTTFLEIV